MAPTDDLLSDALRRLLAASCTSGVVREIEAGRTHEPLWSLIEDSGFGDAMVAPEQGGAGLSLAEAFPLLEQCGASALPVPLAQTMFARAVLSRAGVPRPAGSIAFADGAVDEAGRLVCPMVSAGRVADWVLVRREADCLLLPVAQAEKSPAVFCLDAHLAWLPPVLVRVQAFECAEDLRVLQACLYAAQLAGALMSVLERTLQYANDRQQFGRPIGRFQAIQHQLSVIAEHAFAARMAARIGCQAGTLSAHPGSADPLRVAVAKARTSEAALEVAALAHSIHGAIGFTAAFDLHLFTRRLHLWRQAAGSESYWQAAVGRAMLEGKQDPSLDLLRRVTDFR